MCLINIYKMRKNVRALKYMPNATFVFQSWNKVLQNVGYDEYLWFDVLVIKYLWKIRSWNSSLCMI